MSSANWRSSTLSPRAAAVAIRPARPIELEQVAAGAPRPGPGLTSGPADGQDKQLAERRIEYSMRGPTSPPTAEGLRSSSSLLRFWRPYAPVWRLAAARHTMPMNMSLEPGSVPRDG